MNPLYRNYNRVSIQRADQIHQIRTSETSSAFRTEVAVNFYHMVWPGSKTLTYQTCLVFDLNYPVANN